MLARPLTDESDATGLLALQGPAAFDVLTAATGYDASYLSFYHFDAVTDGTVLGLSNVIISRTGYTGEPGVEIYCRAEDTGTIWDALMSVADQFGMQPNRTWRSRYVTFRKRVLFCTGTTFRSRPIR